MPNAAVWRSDPGFAVVLAGVEGTDDRRASGGLCGDQPRERAVDQAHRSKLAECLVDPDQADTAAGRIDDDIRRLSIPAVRRTRAQSSSCPRSGRAPSASKRRKVGVCATALPTIAPASLMRPSPTPARLRSRGTRCG